MKQVSKILISVLLVILTVVGLALAEAEYDPVNPLFPFKTPVSGMFHEQKVDADGVTGQYTVYIPEKYEHRRDSVFVLVPGGTTAREFVEDGSGQAWKALSDKYGIATIYLEPQDGQTWNIAGSSSDRDDIAYLKKVMQTTRSNSKDITASYNQGEVETYLVGYQEGGIMAHKFAMEWPAYFAGMASVGGAAVPQDYIESQGNKYASPFIEFGSETLGVEENQIPNKDIPLPVWIIRSSDDAMNSQAMEEYWISANKALEASGNNYAQTVYTSRDPYTRVWITDASEATPEPEIIWKEFLHEICRFVGGPGGRLAERVDIVANADGSGFRTNEEMVDGWLRQWITYVPTFYEPGTKVPLVIAMDGYGAVARNFVGKARWHDVAEKNRFILIIPQNIPVEGGYGSNNIPRPYWNHMLPLKPTGADDVAFIKHIIALTKHDYSIDESRVYVTGHSNGAGMTWRLALDAPELFTAVAPVGVSRSGYKDNVSESSYLLPVLLLKTEHDVDAAIDLSPDTENAKALAYWRKYNGTEESPSGQTTNGNFEITDYSNSLNDAPLVRWIAYMNAAHAYTPDMAHYVWDSFFSKYTRGEDGTLYYEGKAVKTEF